MDLRMGCPGLGLLQCRISSSTYVDISARHYRTTQDVCKFAERASHHRLCAEVVSQRYLPATSTLTRDGTISLASATCSSERAVAMRIVGKAGPGAPRLFLVAAGKEAFGSAILT